MREKVAKSAYHHAKENKVTLHPFIKNHFRSLFLVLLFLLGTLLVFFSVAGLFVLPILWCVFACSHRFSEKPVIVFFDKAFQKVAEMLKTLIADGIEIRRVDLGGGLGIPYKDGENPPSFSQYADVVVLARELTIPQIKAISRAIRERDIRGPHGELLRIEMFAHGALCMAISGKCYLSLHDNTCSANRGSCRQICRRSYIVRDKESGEELEINNHYIMSPKDLCTIDFLDLFLDAGVRVLKIEGRARSAEYVKRVVECYDEALRAIEAGTYTPGRAAAWKERLRTVFNRGFWHGYYMGERAGEWSRHYGSSATMKKMYIGKITNFFARIGVAEIHVEAAPLHVGESVFITGETTGVVEFNVEEIRVALKPEEMAPQGVYCSVKTPVPVRRGDKLYKMVPSGKED